MNSFFHRNLNFTGRMARGVAGTICLISGIILADYDLPACLVLVGLGLFAISEAACAWSLVRAFGIKHPHAQPGIRSVIRDA
jgi:hypothetical protein